MGLGIKLNQSPGQAMLIIGKPMFAQQGVLIIRRAKMLYMAWIIIS